MAFDCMRLFAGWYYIGPLVRQTEGVLGSTTSPCIF